MIIFAFNDILGEMISTLSDHSVRQHKSLQSIRGSINVIKLIIVNDRAIIFYLHSFISLAARKRSLTYLNNTQLLGKYIARNVDYLIIKRYNNLNHSGTKTYFTSWLSNNRITRQSDIPCNRRNNTYQWPLLMRLYFHLPFQTKFSTVFWNYSYLFD